jgi:hypothetical protein
VTWNGVRIGCANARNKGICSNKTTMRRDDLEAAVLEGLQHRLMDPDLMAVFCEEYARHMNALTQEHNALSIRAVESMPAPACPAVGRRGAASLARLTSRCYRR